MPESVFLFTCLVKEHIIFAIPDLTSQASLGKIHGFDHTRAQLLAPGFSLNFQTIFFKRCPPASHTRTQPQLSFVVDAVQRVIRDQRASTSFAQKLIPSSHIYTWTDPLPKADQRTGPDGRVVFFTHGDHN
jgi:hypothetical protein